jgi:hypothetical protein
VQHLALQLFAVAVSMKRQPPTLGSPWAVLWLVVVAVAAFACLPASIAGNPGLGEGVGECDNERSCSADAEQVCPRFDTSSSNFYAIHDAE